MGSNTYVIAATVTVFSPSTAELLSAVVPFNEAFSSPKESVSLSVGEALGFVISELPGEPAISLSGFDKVSGGVETSGLEDESLAPGLAEAPKPVAVSELALPSNPVTAFGPEEISPDSGLAKVSELGDAESMLEGDSKLPSVDELSEEL